jgi:hypothetical protein
MTRDALKCSEWPEYQAAAIAADLRMQGRAYVENERRKVEAIRAAVMADAVGHPDQRSVIAELDIVLQRFALVLDEGGNA